MPDCSGERAGGPREPAALPDHSRRTFARRGRGGRPGPRPPAGDPEWRGRRRQDAARPGGRRGARPGVPGRRVAGRAGTRGRRRRRARRHRHRPRRHPAGRCPRHRHRGRGAGGTSRAGRGRQLRAPAPSGRGRHRRDPGPFRRPSRPGHLAGAPARAGRDAADRLAAGGGRRDVRRGDAVRRAGPWGQARLRDLRRADGGRRDPDLRDPRRSAPRHRAGRGADGGHECRRGVRPARPTTPAADRTRARAGSPGDPAPRRGLVLRPAGRRRTRDAAGGVGLRGWLRPAGAVRRRRGERRHRRAAHAGLVGA